MSVIVSVDYHRQQAAFSAEIPWGYDDEVKEHPEVEVPEKLRGQFAKKAPVTMG
ncbi:hypothetical protein GYB43_13750 [bacterium]|nr:hypothetical protein [bacterium]